MLFQRKHPQTTREQARQMFEDGAPFAVIGRALDVPPRTLRNWAETEGWERPEGIATTTPAIQNPARRARTARPKDRQRAFDETWGVVLRQLAIVLALPGATLGEMTRFEGEMRRLMLLVGLLTKLAPLLKGARPSRPVKEVCPDVPDPPDHGALLEAVARRFDAFDAAKRAAGPSRHAEPRGTAGDP